MESSAPSDSEVRGMIKFLNVEGVTGSEIHRRFSSVYSEPYTKPKMWFRWSTFRYGKGPAECSRWVLH